MTDLSYYKTDTLLTLFHAGLFLQAFMLLFSSSPAQSQHLCSQKPTWYARQKSMQKIIGGTADNVGRLSSDKGKLTIQSAWMNSRNVRCRPFQFGSAAVVGLRFQDIDRNRGNNLLQAHNSPIAFLGS